MTLRRRHAQAVCKGASSQKSRIRETDADSSTDAIGGWTKNTQNPIFFEKRKKSSKTQKLKNV